MMLIYQTYCRMVRILIEDELEERDLEGGECGPTEAFCTLRTNREKPQSGSRCPDRNYNRASPEYNSGPPQSPGLQSVFRAG